MKYSTIALLLALFLTIVSACSSDPVPTDGPRGDMVAVRFTSRPYAEVATRVAENNSFEQNDEIGIFCVDTATTHKDSVEYSGNYADNLRYRYLADRDAFVPTADSIMQYRHNVNAFTYFFVYPHTYAAAPKFAFEVRRNQTTHENYTKSDLALQKLTTRDLDVNLHLHRMMANVRIRVVGTGLTSHAMSAQVTQVLTRVNVDLNAQKATADASYARNTVQCEQYKTKDDTVAFHAIIAPQRLEREQTEVRLTVDGNTVAIALPYATVNIPSNYRLTLTYEMEEDENGDIRFTYGGEEVGEMVPEAHPFVY